MNLQLDRANNATDYFYGKRTNDHAIGSKILCWIHLRFTNLGVSTLFTQYEKILRAI
jgi:hypothetical protein